MKNFKHGQNFGGNTNVNRVSFVGWWLVVGGWLVVGSWWLVECVFFLHTQISELTVYTSYTRSKDLAPLGKMKSLKKEIQENIDFPYHRQKFGL